MEKHRTFQLIHNNKLIVCAYDKQKVFDFSRKNKIRGTLIEQYEPMWVLRLIKQRGKLLIDGNAINIG